MTDFIVVAGPYGFAIVTAIGLYAAFVHSQNPNIGSEWAVNLLNSSKEGRRFIIIFLSTYYVFLRMEVSKHAIKSGLGIIAAFIAIRMLAIIAIVTIFYLMNQRSVADVLDAIINSTIGLPLIVLLLCPP